MVTLHSPTPVSADTPDDAVVSQNSVGLILSSARRSSPEAWSQQDVAKRLNLRVDMIRWLEEDAYDQLPPLLFVQGYVRAYAQLLALPVDTLLQQLTQTYPQPSEAERHRDDLVVPIKLPKMHSINRHASGKRRRVTIFLAAVLLLGGVVTYRVFVDGVTTTSISGKLQQLLPTTAMTVPLAADKQ